jgi:hypothetical protein
MDAAWEQQIVRADVGADHRWPELGTQAAQLGVGSMMCFQLFVAGDQLGALNMYFRTRGHMPRHGMVICGKASRVRARAVVRSVPPLQRRKPAPSGAGLSRILV